MEQPSSDADLERLKQLSVAYGLGPWAVLDPLADEVTRGVPVLTAGDRSAVMETLARVVCQPDVYAALAEHRPVEPEFRAQTARAVDRLHKPLTPGPLLVDAVLEDLAKTLARDAGTGDTAT